MKKLNYINGETCDGLECDNFWSIDGIEIKVKKGTISTISKYEDKKVNLHFNSLSFLNENIHPIIIIEKNDENYIGRCSFNKRFGEYNISFDIEPNSKYGHNIEVKKL